MLRKFTPPDLEQIMQIWLQANIETHSFIPARYWQDNYQLVQRQIQQADIFVYEQAGEILGFAGLSGSYLAGIFVAAGRRSQGIGSQLLARIKQDYPSFSLNVYQKNQRACNFYLRQGLKITAAGQDAATGEAEYTMVWPG